MEEARTTIPTIPCRDPRPPAFAELLRRFRVAAGWTQEELAERAAVSARAITNYESGATLRPQHETVRLLADALDLPPAERALFAATARPQRLPPAPAIPLHLPAPPTPLLGRARAVAALCTMLREDPVRMLTVTGPGGVGKTRLALEVATRLLPGFADGVFFVPLASVHDPGLVPSAVAQAIGISEDPRRPVDERLYAAIGRKQLLIVLDNCEHLIAAGSFVAELLASCPSIRILATSREPIHIRAERVYLLQPLALPAPQRVWDVATLSRSPAVALFVDRAAAASASFALSAANAPAVAAICRRLDGLPLAIELAAARIRLLSPDALLQRLERRLPLLIGGAQDLPVRQRTMYAAIAWSCDLLADEERVLFRRLAVFVGGFTIEAVEAVVAMLDGTAGRVLGTLTSLVDKSLVSTDDTGGAGRYAILETVREFGLAELAVTGEAAATERAHAACFLALIEPAERGLVGADQAAWLERLDAERDNLRAALDLLVARGQTEGALRFGWGVGRFWLIRGQLAEGRERLREIAALGGAGAYPSLLAKVQFWVGMLALEQGDTTAARAAFEGIREAAQRMGDRALLSDAYTQLGFLAAAAGDFATGRTWGEDALAIRRVVGDPWHIAISLRFVGAAAVHQGDYETGRAYLEESVQLFRGLGDRLNHASALRALAQLALAQQDIPRAHALICASLGHAHALGNPRRIAAGLQTATEIALAQALPHRAALLLGAVGALDDAMSIHPHPYDGATLDRLRAETRAVLGDAAFSEAWETGEAMPLDEVVRQAVVLHGLTALQRDAAR